MLGVSKLKTMKAYHAIATQGKLYLTKTSQNSPKVCQKNAKNMLKCSQNKLEWEAKSSSTLG